MFEPLKGLKATRHTFLVFANILFVLIRNAYTIFKELIRQALKIRHLQPIHPYLSALILDPAEFEELDDATTLPEWAKFAVPRRFLSQADLFYYSHSPLMRRTFVIAPFPRWVGIAAAETPYDFQEHKAYVQFIYAYYASIWQRNPIVTWIGIVGGNWTAVRGFRLLETLIFFAGMVYYFWRLIGVTTLYAIWWCLKYIYLIETLGALIVILPWRFLSLIGRYMFFGIFWYCGLALFYLLKIIANILWPYTLFHSTGRPLYYRSSFFYKNPQNVTVFGSGYVPYYNSWQTKLRFVLIEFKLANQKYNIDLVKIFTTKRAHTLIYWEARLIFFIYEFIRVLIKEILLFFVWVLAGMFYYVTLLLQWHYDKTLPIRYHKFRCKVSLPLYKLGLMSLKGLRRCLFSKFFVFIAYSMYALICLPSFALKVFFAYIYDKFFYNLWATLLNIVYIVTKKIVSFLILIWNRLLVFVISLFFFSYRICAEVVCFFWVIIALLIILFYYLLVYYCFLFPYKLARLLVLICYYLFIKLPLVSIKIGIALVHYWLNKLSYYFIYLFIVIFAASVCLITKGVPKALLSTTMDNISSLPVKLTNTKHKKVGLTLIATLREILYIKSLNYFRFLNSKKIKTRVRSNLLTSFFSNSIQVVKNTIIFLKGFYRIIDCQVLALHKQALKLIKVSEYLFTVVNNYLSTIIAFMYSKKQIISKYSSFFFKTTGKNLQSILSLAYNLLFAPQYSVLYIFICLCAFLVKFVIVTLEDLFTIIITQPLISTLWVIHKLIISPIIILKIIVRFVLFVIIFVLQVLKEFQLIIMSLISLTKVSTWTCHLLYKLSVNILKLLVFVTNICLFFIYEFICVGVTLFSLGFNLVCLYYIRKSYNISGTNSLLSAISTALGYTYVVLLTLFFHSLALILKIFVYFILPCILCYLLYSVPFTLQLLLVQSFFSLWIALHIFRLLVCATLLVLNIIDNLITVATQIIRNRTVKLFGYIKPIILSVLYYVLLIAISIYSIWLALPIVIYIIIIFSILFILHGLASVVVIWTMWFIYYTVFWFIYINIGLLLFLLLGFISSPLFYTGSVIILITTAILTLQNITTLLVLKISTIIKYVLSQGFIGTTFRINSLSIYRIIGTIDLLHNIYILYTYLFNKTIYNRALFLGLSRFMNGQLFAIFYFIGDIKYASLICLVLDRLTDKLVWSFNRYKAWVTPFKTGNVLLNLLALMWRWKLTGLQPILAVFDSFSLLIVKLITYVYTGLHIIFVDITCIVIDTVFFIITIFFDLVVWFYIWVENNILHTFWSILDLIFYTVVDISLYLLQTSIYLIFLILPRAITLLALICLEETGKILAKAVYILYKICLSFNILPILAMCFRAITHFVLYLGVSFYNKVKVVLKEIYILLKGVFIVGGTPTYIRGPFSMIFYIGVLIGHVAVLLLGFFIFRPLLIVTLYIKSNKVLTVIVYKFAQAIATILLSIYSSIVNIINIHLIYIYIVCYSLLYSLFSIFNVFFNMSNWIWLHMYIYNHVYIYKYLFTRIKPMWFRWYETGIVNMLTRFISDLQQQILIKLSYFTLTSLIKRSLFNGACFTFLSLHTNIPAITTTLYINVNVWFSKIIKIINKIFIRLENRLGICLQIVSKLCIYLFTIFKDPNSLGSTIQTNAVLGLNKYTVIRKIKRQNTFRSTSTIYLLISLFVKTIYKLAIWISVGIYNQSKELLQLVTINPLIRKCYYLMIHITLQNKNKYVLSIRNYMISYKTVTIFIKESISRVFISYIQSKHLFLQIFVKTKVLQLLRLLKTLLSNLLYVPISISSYVNCLVINILIGVLLITMFVVSVIRKNIIKIYFPISTLLDFLEIFVNGVIMIMSTKPTFSVKWDPIKYRVRPLQNNNVEYNNIAAHGLLKEPHSMFLLQSFSNNLKKVISLLTYENFLNTPAYIIYVIDNIKTALFEMIASVRKFLTINTYYKYKKEFIKILFKFSKYLLTIRMIYICYRIFTFLWTRWSKFFFTKIFTPTKKVLILWVYKPVLKSYYFWRNNIFWVLLQYFKNWYKDKGYRTIEEDNEYFTHLEVVEDEFLEDSIDWFHYLLQGIWGFLTVPFLYIHTFFFLKKNVQRWLEQYTTLHTVKDMADDLTSSAIHLEQKLWEIIKRLYPEFNSPKPYDFWIRFMTYGFSWSIFFDYTAYNIFKGLEALDNCGTFVIVYVASAGGTIYRYFYRPFKLYVINIVLFIRSVFVFKPFLYYMYLLLIVIKYYKKVTSITLKLILSIILFIFMPKNSITLFLDTLITLQYKLWAIDEKLKGHAAELTLDVTGWSEDLVSDRQDFSNAINSVYFGIFKYTKWLLLQIGLTLIWTARQIFLICLTIFKLIMYINSAFLKIGYYTTLYLTGFKCLYLALIQALIRTPWAIVILLLFFMWYLLLSLLNYIDKNTKLKIYIIGLLNSYFNFVYIICIYLGAFTFYLLTAILNVLVFLSSRVILFIRKNSNQIVVLLTIYWFNINYIYKKINIDNLLTVVSKFSISIYKPCETILYYKIMEVRKLSILSYTIVSSFIKLYITSSCMVLCNRMTALAYKWEVFWKYQYEVEVTRSLSRANWVNNNLQCLNLFIIKIMNKLRNRSLCLLKYIGVNVYSYMDGPLQIMLTDNLMFLKKLYDSIIDALYYFFNYYLFFTIYVVIFKYIKTICLHSMFELNGVMQKSFNLVSEYRPNLENWIVYKNPLGVLNVHILTTGILVVGNSILKVFTPYIFRVLLSLKQQFFIFYFLLVTNSVLTTKKYLLSIKAYVWAILKELNPPADPEVHLPVDNTSKVRDQIYYDPVLITLINILMYFQITLPLTLLGFIIIHSRDIYVRIPDWYDSVIRPLKRAWLIIARSRYFAPIFGCQTFPELEKMTEKQSRLPQEGVSAFVFGIVHLWGTTFDWRVKTILTLGSITLRGFVYAAFHILEITSYRIHINHTLVTLQIWLVTIIKPIIHLVKILILKPLIRLSLANTTTFFIGYILLAPLYVFVWAPIFWIYRGVLSENIFQPVDFESPKLYKRIFSYFKSFVYMIVHIIAAIVALWLIYQFTKLDIAHYHIYIPYPYIMTTRLWIIVFVGIWMLTRIFYELAFLSCTSIRARIFIVGTFIYLVIWDPYAIFELIVEVFFYETPVWEHMYRHLGYHAYPRALIDAEVHARFAPYPPEYINLVLSNDLWHRWLKPNWHLYQTTWRFATWLQLAILASGFAIGGIFPMLIVRKAAFEPVHAYWSIDVRVNHWPHTIYIVWGLLFLNLYYHFYFEISPPFEELVLPFVEQGENQITFDEWGKHPGRITALMDDPMVFESDAWSHSYGANYWRIPRQLNEIMAGLYQTNWGYFGYESTPYASSWDPETGSVILHNADVLPADRNPFDTTNPVSLYTDSPTDMSYDILSNMTRFPNHSTKDVTSVATLQHFMTKNLPVREHYATIPLFICTIDPNIARDCDMSDYLLWDNLMYNKIPRGSSLQEYIVLKEFNNFLSEIKDPMGLSGFEDTYVEMFQQPLLVLDAFENVSKKHCIIIDGDETDNTQFTDLPEWFSIGYEWEEDYLLGIDSGDVDTTINAKFYDFVDEWTDYSDDTFFAQYWLVDYFDAISYEDCYYTNWIWRILDRPSVFSLEWENLEGIDKLSLSDEDFGDMTSLNNLDIVQSLLLSNNVVSTVPQYVDYASTHALPFDAGTFDFNTDRPWYYFRNWTEIIDAYHNIFLPIVAKILAVFATILYYVKLYMAWPFLQIIDLFATIIYYPRLVIEAVQYIDLEMPTANSKCYRFAKVQAWINSYYLGLPMNHPIVQEVTTNWLRYEWDHARMFGPLVNAIQWKAPLPVSPFAEWTPWEPPKADRDWYDIEIAHSVNQPIPIAVPWNWPSGLYPIYLESGEDVIGRAYFDYIITYKSHMKAEPKYFYQNFPWYYPAIWLDLDVWILWEPDGNVWELQYVIDVGRTATKTDIFW